jgi:hypothetical protein
LSLEALSTVANSLVEMGCKSSKPLREEPRAELRAEPTAGPRAREQAEIAAQFEKAARQAASLPTSGISEVFFSPQFRDFLQGSFLEALEHCHYGQRKSALSMFDIFVNEERQTRFPMETCWLEIVRAFFYMPDGYAELVDTPDEVHDEELPIWKERRELNDFILDCR